MRRSHLRDYFNRISSQRQFTPSEKKRVYQGFLEGIHYPNEIFHSPKSYLLNKKIPSRGKDYPSTKNYHLEIYTVSDSDNLVENYLTFPRLLVDYLIGVLWNHRSLGVTYGVFLEEFRQEWVQIDFKIIRYQSLDQPKNLGTIFEELPWKNGQRVVIRYLPRITHQPIGREEWDVISYLYRQFPQEYYHQE